MVRLGVTLGVWILALLCGSCSKPHHARFPTWEPTSALVPAVSDRKLALRRLAVSRRIWQRDDPEYSRYVADEERGLAPATYTYVRSLETSPESVEFTVLRVERGRVT